MTLPLCGTFPLASLGGRNVDPLLLLRLLLLSVLPWDESPVYLSDVFDSWSTTLSVNSKHFSKALLSGRVILAAVDDLG